MNRTAIDQVAKDYWTKYFGAFGEMWVKEVKRRVKSALAGELRTLHARRGSTAPADAPALALTAVAQNQAAGTWDLEGFAMTGAASLLFVATINGEGQVLRAESRPLPARTASAGV